MLKNNESLVPDRPGWGAWRRRHTKKRVQCEALGQICWMSEAIKTQCNMVYLILHVSRM